MRFDDAIDLRRDFPRFTPEAWRTSRSSIFSPSSARIGARHPAQKRYWGEGAAKDDPLQDAAVTLLAEKYGKTPAGRSSSAIH